MAVSCADLLGNTTQRWQSVFGARSERLRTHFEVPWRAMCADPGLSVPGSWAALFAGNPFRTVGGIANELDVAYTTARRAIDRLEAAGIVSLVGPAKGNRVYCARAMLEILDPPQRRGAEQSPDWGLPGEMSPPYAPSRMPSRRRCSAAWQGSRRNWVQTEFATRSLAGAGLGSG